MKKTWKIDIDCPNCAAKVERALQKLPGVVDASVNYVRLVHAAGIITRTMMTTSMSITIITTANAAAVTIIIMIMTMTNASIMSTRMSMVTNTAARTRARS